MPDVTKCPVCAKKALVSPLWLLSEKGGPVEMGVAFTMFEDLNKEEDGRKSVFAMLPVDARACGACGHIELYCREPGKIRELLRRAGYLEMARW
jgi:hypothetical protein